MDIIFKDDKLFIKDNQGKEHEVIKVYESFTGWLWLATEYNRKDKTYFGFVIGFEPEWGEFSKEELESMGDQVWEVTKPNWSNVTSYNARMKKLLGEVI